MKVLVGILIALMLPTIVLANRVIYPIIIMPPVIPVVNPPVIISDANAVGGAIKDYGALFPIDWNCKINTYIGSVPPKKIMTICLENVTIEDTLTIRGVQFRFLSDFEYNHYQYIWWGR